RDVQGVLRNKDEAKVERIHSSRVSPPDCIRGLLFQDVFVVELQISAARIFNGRLVFKAGINSRITKSFP
ncbi:MAG TPA: hypothetical protein PKG99_03275, partial [Candidatus Syntrophosphaera thermopropionivorans]|nr:hypothetical protein [Candidatus Syntrophosphaera thermopropionivorans]